jgi:hypothetical protein
MNVMANPVLSLSLFLQALLLLLLAGVCFARDKTQLQFSHQQKKEFFFKSL